MSIEWWLIFGGGTAQALGLVFVGWALRARARRHDYTASSFLAWARERLLARPDVPANVTVSGAAAGVYMTVGLGRGVAHAPIVLPDPQSDPAGFRTAVAEELDKLSIAEKVMRQDLDAAGDKIDKIRDGVRSALASEISGVRAESKRDAVLAVHLDVIGFWVLLAGIVASTIGALIAL